MNPPLMPEAYQQKKDRDHLNLLSIFHFVLGGLALLGIGFLALHYVFMKAVFANAEFWKNQKGVPPFSPAEFWPIIVWFYVVMGVLLVIVSVLNLLSGVFLRQRKHRVFSLVIAGLNCLQIPFGTALGVLTIFVLARDSVREAYGPSSL